MEPLPAFRSTQIRVNLKRNISNVISVATKFVWRIERILKALYHTEKLKDVDKRCKGRRSIKLVVLELFRSSLQLPSVNFSLLLTSLFFSLYKCPTQNAILINWIREALSFCYFNYDWLYASDDNANFYNKSTKSKSKGKAKDTTIHSSHSSIWV